MSIKIIIRIFFCSALFFVLNSKGHAAVQNFSGVYEGNETGFFFGCFQANRNGPFSGFLSITVSQQGNKFTLSVTGQKKSGNAQGTVDPSGQFTATFNDQGASGVIDGAFTSTTFQFVRTILVAGNDGCLGGSSGTLKRVSGGGVGTKVQAQQSRQVVRATNSLISQHLSSVVANAFSIAPMPSSTMPFSASSDQNNEPSLAFWGTTSLTEIHEDNKAVTRFDSDIYQFVGGFDLQKGQLFFGNALTYAYAETEQTGQDSSSQIFGITPYMAYQLTDFMFVSTLAGYNYTYVKDENFGGGTDIHDYIVESNLNFFTTIFQVVTIKSRVGTRFHHSYVSSTDRPLDATADELTWIGDFELGYLFNNKLRTSVGTYYEYFDREDSTHSFKEHDGVLFIRGGFDYPLAQKLTLGGKVQADLTAEDVDIITGSINIRWAI